MVADNLPPVEQVIKSRAGRLPRIALPSLGLRVSERLLLLHAMDYVLLAAALIVAVKARTDWLDTPNALLANWKWFATLAVLWWVVAQFADAYDLARTASAPYSILAAGPAAAVTALLYQWIPVLTPPLASRKLGLIFGLLAVAGIALWRGLYAVLFVQPAFQRRVLVFGAGWAGRTLAEAIRWSADERTPNPYRGNGAVVVGFVDDDPAKHGASVAGVPVLGASQDLPRLAATLKADDVVLAITNRDGLRKEAFDALLACRELGFHVTTMPALYEQLLGRVPVEHVGRNLSAVLPVEEGGATVRLYQAVKRVCDLLGAGLACIPLGLLIPLLWLANALTSPGPLFYRQTRVGKGGRHFQVLKFRTMRPDAEAGCGPVWARANDDRVTPVGRWLRKTRLDELPQVINVLRGEMSIIGPRPERPEFVDQLAASIPFYRARHAVRPGITGWAQVRYGYGSSVTDARIKLEYDLYYVRHCGFYLDALILLKTAAVMFGLQGR